MGTFFARLVPGYFPRSPTHRSHMEQHDRRDRRHGDFHRGRHTLCLWPLEAWITPGDRNTLPLARDPRDCDRHFIASTVSMDFPVAALASRAVHGHSRACRIFDCLCLNCGLRQVEDGEPEP